MVTGLVGVDNVRYTNVHKKSTNEHVSSLQDEKNAQQEYKAHFADVVNQSLNVNVEKYIHDGFFAEDRDLDIQKAEKMQQVLKSVDNILSDKKLISSLTEKCEGVHNENMIVHMIEKAAPKVSEALAVDDTLHLSLFEDCGILARHYKDIVSIAKNKDVLEDISFIAKVASDPKVQNLVTSMDSKVLLQLIGVVTKNNAVIGALVNNEALMRVIDNVRTERSWSDITDVLQYFGDNKKHSIVEYIDIARKMSDLMVSSNISGYLTAIQTPLYNRVVMKVETDHHNSMFENVISYFSSKHDIAQNSPYTFTVTQSVDDDVEITYSSNNNHATAIDKDSMLYKRIIEVANDIPDSRSIKSSDKKYIMKKTVVELSPIDIALESSGKMEKIFSKYNLNDDVLMHVPTLISTLKNVSKTINLLTKPTHLVSMTV